MGPMYNEPKAHMDSFNYSLDIWFFFLFLSGCRSMATVYIVLTCTLFESPNGSAQPILIDVIVRLGQTSHIKRIFQR